MATINLRDFYPWYKHDDFMEVSDEVAAELLSDKRCGKTHERTMRRNKVRSLDAADGTDAAASISSFHSPEAIYEMMERHCRLCRALNSLPEIQGRRVEAHYILGKSKADISKSEGVDEKNVRQSIKRGLGNMRKYMKNNF